MLEHVYAPEVLLGREAAYLKEDGRILLSVPNIAHNSKIINLLQDRYEYKQVGLLDNSHIRLFTYNGFRKHWSHACKFTCQVNQTELTGDPFDCVIPIQPSILPCFLFRLFVLLLTKP